MRRALPCRTPAGRGLRCASNFPLRSVSFPPPLWWRAASRASRARLLGSRDGTRALDLGDFLGRIAEHLGEDFLGMLAQQRRTLHFGNIVGKLDRIADRQILAPRRMIDL